MLRRWQDGLTAVVVTLVTAVLVTLDLTDAGVRRWWAGHALTTDTVAGLLIVLVTVLVVDQVVRRRQIRDRSRAVAAQAAIMVSQAARAARAVSAALTGAGERSAASEEFRTYMMMLLVSAPLLIDSRAPRRFLEQAQRLGGEMARALTTAPGGPPGDAGERLSAAAQQVRAAATPLLAVLDLPELSVTGAGDPA